MELRLRNFRSVKDQRIKLAPITVLYGPNGAGKSSFIYALLTLRNAILNPNQAPAGFFNYGFASLGTYDSVVFDHKVKNHIHIDVAMDVNDERYEYGLSFDETKGVFHLASSERLLHAESPENRLELPVIFPYAVNQQARLDMRDGTHSSYALNWNGVTAQIAPTLTDPERQRLATEIAAGFNAPIEALRKVAVVPLKRGFSKALYSPVSVSPNPTTEDEIATVISNNRYLETKISHYLEKIADRDLRVHSKPGTAIFSLTSYDRKSGTATDLVNEGFGLNQAVQLLAKCLDESSETVCIEEPEIHLHPTAVRKLAHCFVEMTKEESKRFLLTTHSETLVLALAAMVSRGELAPEDLAFYFVHKDKKATSATRETVNEQGQISEGLSTFMQAEVEDLRTLLSE